MHRILLIVLLAVVSVVSAAAEDFTDYRMYLRENSPEKFETTSELSSFYPDSLIIFSQDHPLLWELTGVDALHVKGGRISALLKNGIIDFDDKACGGIVVPDGTKKFVYSDTYLVAFSDNTNYLYFLEDCAMHNQVPGRGDMLAISGQTFCEADAGSRIIRNINTGGILFYDEPDSPVLGVYSGSNGCYFLNGDGQIELFDLKSSQMKYYAYADENLSHMKNTEKGFSGFTNDKYFTVDIDANGILLEYEDMSSAGACVNASGHKGVFCEKYFNAELFAEASAADSVYVGFDEIYMFTQNTLKAYRRDIEWIKKFLTIYEQPDPCMDDNGTVYFKGLLEGFWSLKGDISELYDGELPPGCNESKVMLNSGIFYTDTGEFLYEYAGLVGSQYGRNLYKRVENNNIFYMVNDSH